MGGLPALESLQRMPLPDTPPSLVSPSATSFSSRSSPSTEQAAWGPHASAPLGSMSHYDKASTGDMSIESSGETSQGRPESAGNSSVRQQLPSLSSLFGPPSSVRPLNSPHLERSGPYLSHSPLDRPRLSPGGGSASYFQRTVSPPASQPRSTYDVKFDTERQPAHGLRASFSRPRSPGYRDMSHSRPDSRYGSETPGKWSIHQEASRQEYSLGSRDAPYRSPRDKFPPQFPGSKDLVHDYSEQRPLQVHGSTSNPPPTPTSTVASDVTVSKDGLGPKIWTGTHFLPRFVRAAEVPGEGLCYFYDDGSHCKTVIDGEAVNAHWGVTKAGKPRKRLAIACVTCREKKIKCDPDYPRCVQCEKFGRVCKFKNAPRGGHNTSPSTPPAELDDGRQPNGPVKSEAQHSVSDVGSPRSPREGGRQPSPEAGYSKRLKVGPDAYVSSGEPAAPFMAPMDHSKSQMVEPRPVPELPKIPDDVLERAWRTDPYVSDPQSITGVLTQFFAHVDSTMIIRFLPEEAFKSWVANSVHRKTPEDLMLLYSTLAVGVALSGGPKHIAFEYAQVAHYAQKMSDVPCLRLVQSRILLAVYYVSTCRSREATEIISSAAATCACLQLNLELEHSVEATITVYPLGMNKAGYVEARRRTFWSLFVLERLSGLFPDRPAMINAEDIYTRLPADTHSFERLIETHMPRFDPYKSSFAQQAQPPMEVTGYLVEMVHIWSECQAAVYRMACRPPSSEREASKLQNLMKRTEDWRAALPPRLLFNGPNLESAAFAGNVGSFLSMHLLYHHALVDLNRHRHGATQVSKEIRIDFLQKCRDHATSIIDMLKSLDRILRVRPNLLNTPPPAMAIAVTEAVDVLTASGLMVNLSDLIDSVRVAKSAVDRMTNVWEASSRSGLAIEQRLRKLNLIRDRGSRPASPVEGYRLFPTSEETKDKGHSRWQISDPIEKSFPMDMDMIYSALD